jgi:serralysin
MLPTYSYDQIANFLTDDGWYYFNDIPQQFNVRSGGTITVNISSLNAGGQAFARDAFDLWSDVSGLNFSYVTQRADIDITHGFFSGEAFETSVVNSRGIIQKATITISEDIIWRDWYTNFSGEVVHDQTSYSASTFTHEVGHALGLAHAGNYNFFATYPNDALYANDSTQASIMSYFDTSDNTTVGASYYQTITPMIADVIAIQNLYGTNFSTRSGDTTYGNRSNTNSPLDVLDNAFEGARVGVTVFDTGGVDTFDFSHSSANQRLDLSQEGISDVLGEQGNLIIARRTVIEHAITGAGDDNITGNTSSNQITTGTGSDFILPGSGNDTVNGGSGLDMISFSDADVAVRIDLSTGEATSGGDTNTLISIENATGSIYGDYIVGDDGANRIRGLGDYDWILGSGANDNIDGGTGRDMISYVAFDSGVTINLGAGYVQSSTDSSYYDTLSNIERATGSIHADLTYGSSGEDDFRGLGGYDWFVGSTGGRDRYDGGTGLDTVAYSASSSAVVASLSLGRGSVGDAARDLYTSIENLTGSNHNDTLYGDAGRNILRGQYGDDRLFGEAGVDKLTGGKSNDFLNGGSGFDRAYYSGNRYEYDISTSDGVTTVTHNRSGGDGTDTLVSIEALVFSDELLYL